MRLTVIGLIVAFAADNSAADEMLYRTCVSPTGNSIYDVEINLSLGQGLARYRYFGQDVFYTMTITSAEGDVLKGVAEFQSSRSGETKGNSWVFEYDSVDNILTDNGMECRCK